MADRLLMLALSPTMEQGTITKWRKQPGDEISSGDVICEVETDKATMDYEATVEGTLLKIIIDEGGKAAVGDTIGIIGEQDEDFSELESDIQNEKKQKSKKQEDSDETPSDSKDEKDEPDSLAPAQSEPQTVASPPQTGHIKASPLARRIAQDKGLDLRSINGSGPGGRIVKRDVEQASPQQQSAMSAAPSLQDQTVPVSGKRQVIADRLAASKFSAPHYYLRVSVEVDALLEARKNLNAKRDTKVSLNSFLMKFVAESLKRHPMVNASWQGDTIRKFGSVDIGLAVAVNDGLITPVVRQCGAKGITSIDAELTELIDKARTNRLSQDEYSNATFTISNLGSFGIDEFTAIINPPGSAILAVGATQKVPVVIDDENIAVAQVMQLTLSCDHRVIDGAVGAAFLKDLKDMIEEPIRALY